MPCTITFPCAPVAKHLDVPDESCTSVTQAKSYLQQYTEVGLTPESYYLSHHGCAIGETASLLAGENYRACIRIVGGKGGFGSMLRAMGSQIEKTTNTESCRDLSGRRMRDVNNEKKMVDFVKQKAAEEKERERKKIENLEKKLLKPKHFFNDPEYEKQVEEISKNLDSSIKSGIIARKRRMLETKKSVVNKKKKSIFKDDDSDSSDSDSPVTSSDEEDSEDEEPEAEVAGSSGISSKTVTGSEGECESDASK